MIGVYVPRVLCGRVVMRRLCVFCGSTTGQRALYADSARQLGELLAAHGVALIYGGGHIGLMGILADAVLRSGGQAIGVIPQALVDKELAHAGLTRLHIVTTMHERKALMADLSDGFAALPGAFGTGDELLEVLTWAQLGIHAKPVALLNVAGYFDSLTAWLDHAVAEGFLRSAHRRLLLQAENPQDLLVKLDGFRPGPATPKWIEAVDR
jgi:uncharacterized protein (TIGR00730 family)